MSFLLSPDINNNKVFLVKHCELEGRLDPFCYIPELVKLDKKIKSKTDYRLKDFSIFRASGATPSKSHDEYYSDKENGIPFIRVQNLSTTGELNQSDLIYISKDIHEGLLKRSQVKEHDLLVKITGVGRMAVASVVPDGFVGNINQHIVVVRTGSKEISENIATFLNLDAVENIATKRATGGTRPALDYPALFSIPVINDRNIYNKVNKSVAAKKKKEAEAQQLLSSIDEYLLAELGIKQSEAVENTLQSRMFTRQLKEVFGGRLDPNTYRYERMSAIKSIKDSSYPVKPLSQIVEFKTDKTNHIDEQEKYIGLENVESNTGEWVSSKSKESISSASIFNSDDILFPKLRPYLNKVFHSDCIGLCSTEFHVLNSHTENNSYIANFLRSKVVISQTENLMSGNTLPRLQFEDIQKLLVPVPPPEKQLEMVRHIASIRTQAKRLRLQAKKELEQAKKAVEVMILGEA